MDCFTDVFTTFMDLGTFQLCFCLWVWALWFHQKHLHLCSEDERRSWGFGTTWGWIINDRIFVLGWNYPFKGDDTQGNFLSIVVLAFSHRELISHCAIHFYLDTLDRPWALCLTWLPIDGNIAQKVAQSSPWEKLVSMMNNQRANIAYDFSY